MRSILITTKGEKKMNELIKTAKDIDRILESGIEILPNSPIHEKLKKNIIMAQKYSKPDNTAIDYASVLSAGNSYKLGKFQIILDEDTGNLKVYVHTNSDHMQITPKSDNSVVIHACR